MQNERERESLAFPAWLSGLDILGRLFYLPHYSKPFLLVVPSILNDFLDGLINAFMSYSVYGTPALPRSELRCSLAN